VLGVGRLLTLVSFACMWIGTWFRRPLSSLSYIYLSFLEVWGWILVEELLEIIVTCSFDNIKTLE